MGDALGLVETRGFVGLFAATDAMGKAANVELIKTVEIAGGRVTAIVRGDFDDVQAAVDAGAAAARAIGELESSAVFPGPQEGLLERILKSMSRSDRRTDGTPVAGNSASMNGWLASAEAQPIKEEICMVGRKLWQRMYVDGNGGNISYRITPNAVICTPTLLSKFDLRPEDLCVVDLEGNQLEGTKARTSEIFLHLEIYKAVPEAKAVVHCHPPHATAYAITGLVPPTRIIPECEVFVGKVAIAPYETPGTTAFAQTVLPFVKQHNTVLLANHGIVCWADTVTHAEWYAEILDTYCWTLLVASQLGSPLSYIPPEKTSDLLNIKKRLGLPDIRFHGPETSGSEIGDPQCPASDAQSSPAAVPTNGEVDSEVIVKAVTDAVRRTLSGNNKPGVGK